MSESPTMEKTMLEFPMLESMVGKYHDGDNRVGESHRENAVPGRPFPIVS